MSAFSLERTISWVGDAMSKAIIVFFWKKGNNNTYTTANQALFFYRAIIINVTISVRINKVVKICSKLVTSLTNVHFVRCTQ
jgi:hypothetical protein